MFISQDYMDFWSSESPFFEHLEIYVDNSRTAKKHLIDPHPSPSYCKMKKTISRGFFYYFVSVRGGGQKAIKK